MDELIKAALSGQQVHAGAATNAPGGLFGGKH